MNLKKLFFSMMSEMKKILSQTSFSTKSICIYLSSDIVLYGYWYLVVNGVIQVLAVIWRSRSEYLVMYKTLRDFTMEGAILIIVVITSNTYHYNIIIIVIQYNWRGRRNIASPCCFNFNSLKLWVYFVNFMHQVLHIRWMG